MISDGEPSAIPRKCLGSVKEVDARGFFREGAFFARVGMLSCAKVGGSF